MTNTDVAYHIYVFPGHAWLTLSEIARVSHSVSKPYTCSYDAAVAEVPESCTATIPGSEPAYTCGNYSVRDYATGVWEYAVVDKVKPATSRSFPFPPQ